MGKLEQEIAAIRLDADPLSRWLHEGLTDGGFEAVLMETRRVKAALQAMPNQDGSPGCRGRRTASADGLVPADALQVGVIAGDARVADLAQVRAGRAHQHGTLAARRSA